MTNGRLPAVRAVRSLALTSTAVGAGLVAHWAAGGATPHLAALLVVLGLLTIPVVRLSAREVSPVVAATVLGAGQLAVHLLGMASRGSASAGGHGHGHTLSLTGTTSSGSGLGMVAGHLAVAAVLAAAWSRGERILFAVAARLRPPSVPTWSVPVPARVLATVVVPAGSTAVLRPPSRGPPLLER